MGTYLQQRRACESESAGESACPTWLARNGEPISNSAAHASRNRQAKAPAPPGLQEMGNLSPTAPRMRVGVGRRKRLPYRACKKWGTYFQQRRACESESAGESACPTWLARNGEPISNNAAHASRSRQVKAPALPGLQEMGTYTPTMPRMRFRRTTRLSWIAGSANSTSSTETSGSGGVAGKPVKRRRKSVCSNFTGVEVP
jgi:post-segregation antitoxin (ccd killing protein)